MLRGLGSKGFLDNPDDAMRLIQDLSHLAKDFFSRILVNLRGAIPLGQRSKRGIQSSDDSLCR